MKNTSSCRSTLTYEEHLHLMYLSLTSVIVLFVWSSFILLLLVYIQLFYSKTKGCKQQQTNKPSTRRKTLTFNMITDITNKTRFLFTLILLMEGLFYFYFVFYLFYCLLTVFWKTNKINIIRKNVWTIRKYLQDCKNIFYTELFRLLLLLFNPTWIWFCLFQ